MCTRVYFFLIENNILFIILYNHLVFKICFVFNRIIIKIILSCVFFWNRAINLHWQHYWYDKNIELFAHFNIVNVWIIIYKCSWWQNYILNYFFCFSFLIFLFYFSIQDLVLLWNRQKKKKITTNDNYLFWPNFRIIIIFSHTPNQN